MLSFAMQAATELIIGHLFYRIRCMTQQIFVSHATKNDDVVDRLIDALQGQTECAYWVDHHELQPPTNNWRQAIQNALESSQAGLVVLSQAAIGRDEIEAEWNYLLNTNRPLYVVRVDDVSFTDINYRLQLVQWLDLAEDWDAGLKALIAAINGQTPDKNAPVLHVRPVTGRIDRRLMTIPIHGRDYGIWALRKRLEQAPTMVLGIGGIGKSRIAAEMMVSSPDIDGGVWFNCQPTSEVNDLLASLRQHFQLKSDATEASILAKLKQHKRLIVLDNAESIADEKRRAFADIINALFESNAQVMVVSRTEWLTLDTAESYRPQRPGDKNAANIVTDMRDAFHVHHDLSKVANRMASAARNHPGLIEWAVKQCKRFPPERVIHSLRRLKSKRLAAALDEMVNKTIKQMVREHGTGPRNTLQWLCVFRGGFDYAAAATILADINSDTRDDHLEILTTWQLLRAVAIRHDTRYWVDPLVIEILNVNPDAAERHCAYYRDLAERCHHDGDYSTLFPEIANLSAAGSFDNNFGAWLDDIWDDVLLAEAELG